MKTKLFVVLLVLSSVLGMGRAEENWTPAKTWVFMVGVLEWDDVSFEPYSQDNRRDTELVAALEKQGVPKNQILILNDQDATHDRITKEFAKFAAKADGTLIVYYTGYGKKDDDGAAYFIPYDASDDLAETGWSVASIFDTIEKKFKGTNSFLFADCEKSGAIAEEIASHKGSFVSLASTQHNSLAPSTSWTFTESLIAGFSGDARADLNHDGKITLGEIAKFTESEVAFVDDQLPSFASTGKSLDNIIISKASPAPDSRYGERVMVGEDEEDLAPARILETDKKRVKVHHYNGETEDEWVEAGTVHPWKPKKYEQDAEVQILWPEDETWYDSTVIDSKLGIPYIHYDGYGDEWDEWVTVDRIRPRQ